MSLSSCCRRRLVLFSDSDLHLSLPVSGLATSPLSTVIHVFLQLRHPRTGTGRSRRWATSCVLWTSGGVFPVLGSWAYPSLLPPNTNRRVSRQTAAHAESPNRPSAIHAAAWCGGCMGRHGRQFCGCAGDVRRGACGGATAHG